MFVCVLWHCRSLMIAPLLSTQRLIGRNTFKGISPPLYKYIIYIHVHTYIKNKVLKNIMPTFNQIPGQWPRILWWPTKSALALASDQRTVNFDTSYKYYARVDNVCNEMQIESWYSRVEPLSLPSERLILLTLDAGNGYRAIPTLNVRSNRLDS